MAWNWREIQSILLASKAFQALFAGHDHEGGYAEIDGRHFVTLKAMLEGMRIQARVLWCEVARSIMVYMCNGL
jgi:hypothetical protein